MEKAAGAGNEEEEEEICRRKYGKWRCKNASADNELHYCQKRYNLRAKKTTREAPGSGPIEDETREWRRSRKKVMEEEDDDDTYDTIVGGASSKIEAKRKKIESTSEELKSSTEISEPVLEWENLDHYKTERFQVSVELELAKKELELAKTNLELEKKNAASDEDATEYWRNKCSDLDIVVLALEIEYLIMRYEETRESKRSRKKNVTEEKDDGSVNDTCDFSSVDLSQAPLRKTDKEGGSANVVTKTKLPPDGQRCCISSRGWRCKNFRMGHGAAADDDRVPKTNHCEKHYSYFANYNQMLRNKTQMMKKKPPPVGERCCQTGGGGWRCKNFRMGHDAASDDDTVPNTRYCEKHYKHQSREYKQKMQFKIVEIRGSKRRRKKVAEEMEKNKLLPPDEQRCCLTNGSTWRCKKARMCHAAVDDETFPKTIYCEKHHNLRAKYYENLKEEEEEMEKKLPPDEHGCSQTNGSTLRCRNFRKRSWGRESAYCSATGPRKCRGSKRRRKVTEEDDRTLDITEADTIKKRSGDGEAAGCSATGPTEYRGLKWRRKKVTEEDNRSFDVTGSMQPATSDDDTSVTISEGRTGNIRRKRKNVGRAEDDQFVDDTLGEFEGFDGYVDSENSVGDLMDMLGMENWNWNNDKMKWNSEADMLSCFEEDPVLSYL